MKIFGTTAVIANVSSVLKTFSINTIRVITRSSNYPVMCVSMSFKMQHIYHGTTLRFPSMGKEKKTSVSLLSRSRQCHEVVKCLSSEAPNVGFNMCTIVLVACRTSVTICCFVMVPGFLLFISSLIFCEELSKSSILDGIDASASFECIARCAWIFISSCEMALALLKKNRFNHLIQKETVVRWSAAKGIGRIASRLTSTLSDDVLSSILELFSPCEGDGSWHGGCLAMAELARRGLLLPNSFSEVVPLITKALHYDVRRGPHSIGSHERDAAAYVCWAIGRAYSHSDMKSVLEQLSPHLLAIACCDRQVSCTRAAAFQENVSGQGNFPLGLLSLGLLSLVNFYLNVAVSIGEYNAYLSSVVFDKFMPCTLSSDLCMRHGATLALGEQVLALSNLGVIFSTEMQKQMSGIVPVIEKARLYRGKDGEIMRSGRIHLPNKIKANLLVLNEKLKHPNAQIQIQVTDFCYYALRHFFPAYLSEFFPAHGKMDDPNDRDAEARVNAVRGLTSVCETFTRPGKDHLDLEEKAFSIEYDVFQTLLKALYEDSVDYRGDDGSWVREAAMRGLESCTYILCDEGFAPSKEGETHLLFDGNLATDLIGGLLKQAVAKMGKTRETAGKILSRILYNPKDSIVSVKLSDTLKKIFVSDTKLEWRVLSVSFPRLVNLLQFDCYRKLVISGLVVSIGGLQSSLQKASIGAVLDHLQVSHIENEREQKQLKLSANLYRKCDRFIIPTLESPCQNFPSILLVLEIEAKGSKDFSKLLICISIRGYLTSVPDPINIRAFSCLVSFLSHRYPKIPEASGDQLDLVLV